MHNSRARTLTLRLSLIPSVRCHQFELVLSSCAPHDRSQDDSRTTPADDHSHQHQHCLPRYHRTIESAAASLPARIESLQEKTPRLCLPSRRSVSSQDSRVCGPGFTAVGCWSPATPSGLSWASAVTLSSLASGGPILPASRHSLHPVPPHAPRLNLIYLSRFPIARPSRTAFHLSGLAPHSSSRQADPSV